MSFSTAAGDGVPAAVMSKQTPIIFLAVAPEYNALSDDMTATAAHYSGQPLGLLKDVMLSVLPFKAGGKNNAVEHYTDTGRNHHKVLRAVNLQWFLVLILQVS